jgi:hypothetical protein
MSLYQSNPNPVQAPAKLWIGKTAPLGSVPAMELEIPRLLAVVLLTILLQLLSFLCRNPESWVRRNPLDWKSCFRPDLSAFSFRPPPAQA